MRKEKILINKLYLALKKDEKFCKLCYEESDHRDIALRASEVVNNEITHLRTLLEEAKELMKLFDTIGDNHIKFPMVDDWLKRVKEELGE